MRSKWQTSLIRKNCNVSMTGLSSGATGVGDGETFEDVVMDPSAARIALLPS